MKKLLFTTLTTSLLVANSGAIKAGWIKDSQGKYEYHEGIDEKLYNNEQAAEAIDFPQYYQADPRWGSKRYGMSTLKISGCVPTSLTMIISTFVEKTEPDEVADFIYNTAMEMNTTFSGTSTLGAKAALDHWNLNSQIISSKEDLEDALKSGKTILAAVGHGILVRGYSTHAIILSGYQSGKTKAIDPDNPEKTNHWYDVNELWNQQSTEIEDNILGGPFIAIYK